MGRKRKKSSESPAVKKNTSKIGNIGETAVLLDGLTKNFWAYPNSSAEGPVDIIFFRPPNTVIKVQVKVSDRVRDGNAALKVADVLALVDHLNRVRYFSRDPRVCQLIQPCTRLRRAPRPKKKPSKKR